MTDNEDNRLDQTSVISIIKMYYICSQPDRHCCNEQPDITNQDMQFTRQGLTQQQVNKSLHKKDSGHIQQAASSV